MYFHKYLIFYKSASYIVITKIYLRQFGQKIGLKKSWKVFHTAKQFAQNIVDKLRLNFLHILLFF